MTKKAQYTLEKISKQKRYTNIGALVGGIAGGVGTTLGTAKYFFKRQGPMMQKMMPILSDMNIPVVERIPYLRKTIRKSVAHAGASGIIAGALIGAYAGYPFKKRKK